MRKKLLFFGCYSVVGAVLLALFCGCGVPKEIPAAPLYTGEPIEEVTDFVENSWKDESMTEDTENPTKDDNVTDNTSAVDDVIKDKLPLPGVHSMENFLRTAFLPLGATMYVWGGGWNEEDTGAGTEARTLGVSARWKEFADLQNADYNYRNTRYQIHDGLDCSGYVGWVMYNTLENADGKEGYVFKSTETAEYYAQMGYGDLLTDDGVGDWLAGDICSMNGHVWICLGTCEDGSILLVHSSPPGVRLSGTISDGGTSKAEELAKDYLSRYCPEWYNKFPECGVNTSYLKATRMRWNTETFPDAEEIRALAPSELLELLFE